jgi:nicotinate-nucleotide pyrophosphorylase (carboxylating)
MQPQIHKALKDLLLRGLEDDGYSLDWTSMGCATDSMGAEKKAKAEIIAKAEGVFFGAILAQAAEAVSREIGSPFQVGVLIQDGTRVKAGDRVIEWSGSASGILALERPYLNIASYLSGIATRTRGLVDRVESAWKAKAIPASVTPPRVTSTRKILPHYRDISIAAVMAGGGVAHRPGLSGGVLIKENHVASAGGIAQAIQGVRGVAPHLHKIEIEVRDLSELDQALAQKAEVIMLDNFSPTEVVEALRHISKAGFTPLIECSGGISENTITDYALPGVHALSIGGLTHSVKALDLSLLVK